MLGGNDSVLSNDTAVTTIIDMGGGDDSIVVGTVPLVPDPGNRTLEYPDGVPVADTAHMTNGNTATLFVLGGTPERQLRGQPQPRHALPARRRRATTASSSRRSSSSRRTRTIRTSSRT